MAIPLLTNIERLVRAKWNPILIPNYDPRADTKLNPEKASPLWYNLICWLFTFCSMNYIIQPFSLCSFERSMIVLGSYHFAPYILFVVIYLVLSIFPTGGGKRMASTSSQKDKST
jgi:hypothetical protein